MMVELTPRQRQALDLVAQDKRNREIAGQLEISERAVESLLTRTYKNMSVRTRVGAVLGWAYMRAMTQEAQSN